MTVERLCLDANILFYAIDADAGERQQRAREIVSRAALGDCFLSLQTLSEFFASTTRKGNLALFSREPPYSSSRWLERGERNECAR